MSTTPATAAAPERPLPTPTRESQPSGTACAKAASCSSTARAAARRGTIRGRSARTASRWRAPSRRCATGGAIHTWTVCHHPFNFFFKASAPYVVALVDMDAGVRVNAPLRGIAESDIKIGQRVRLGFEPVTKEITLPFFVAG